jgi:xanthine dehydrogenase accessory factor
MNDVDRINDLLDQAQLFCLATVIASSDDTVPAGHRWIIARDGTLEFGSGRPAVDERIKSHALTCLGSQKKEAVEMAPGLTVFFDILSAAASLIICGAGHIAVPLARFAGELGFSVTVIDDRSDFANPVRFPGCTVIAGEFIPSLRSVPINRAAYVVVVTRGHEHDAECLEEVLTHETAYVGLIGSRRRVGFVLEMLAQKGVPQGRLESVCTPIGVPIGAESPEEIALSIAAELVCVRRKGIAQAKALAAVIRKKP